MTEEKKSKNPFIAAAKKVAANPKAPGVKTTQVQLTGLMLNSQAVKVQQQQQLLVD